ncbi:MAG: TatD family hydrolase, partial [Myxococcales bacterium]|nr:TatD family hydrolase [Myxococcales bacterium]
MGRKKSRPRPTTPYIPGLIDSHCHLDYAPMSDDLEAALTRARAAGVEQLVHIGCRLDAFDPALALARAHPTIFTAIGVHPHDASTADDHALARLEALASEHRGDVVAIGETGLD